MLQTLSVKIASISADKAGASAQKAANRSAVLYNKLKISTSLINELRDEIRDDVKAIEELRSKVDEYEVIVDFMEIEYEDKCSEHRTQIASIEAYFQAVIAKYSLRYVVKHWVKNKTRGK